MQKTYICNDLPIAISLIHRQENLRSTKRKHIDSATLPFSFTQSSIMPKVVSKKFNQRTERPNKDRKDGDNNNKAAASASAASAASRAFGPLFNKDLGQHILKNPLVAQGIVDKVNWSATFSLLSWNIGDQGI